MEKRLLSGNEAVCLGAIEAGVAVGVGYPGTPSTEILENLSTNQEIYTEWSVNEKVAMEVGAGASLAGARTLVTTKHVGLNVAADPLFALSYTGVNGGLVIVCADDPNMHSSQNEQDNRNYASFSKIPMLEPADSQEAKDYTRIAFELSEKYDTPVMVRIVTRLAHSKGVVRSSGKASYPKKIKGFSSNPQKYILVPAYSRLRHIAVEERLKRVTDYSNHTHLNTMKIKNKEWGIITSGNSYNYVKEATGDASILKLGITNPLPHKIIAEFCRQIKDVFVVEELDPYLEKNIRAMGYTVYGKEFLPLEGELDQDIIRDRLHFLPFQKNPPKATPEQNTPLPGRPPELCPGCPHRQVFSILSKMDLIVTGDIGCYTLGAFYPFNAIDTVLEMGGSIGMAQGMEIAEGNKKKVAVIGDSTFAHSGITGLLNAAYNKRHILIIVLDNSITAMTGMQPNPFSGKRITGEDSITIDYHKLGQAFGLNKENIRIINAYKPERIKENINQLLESRTLSLLVVKGECIALKKKRKR